MQTCCLLQRQTRLMGILTFCFSFLLIFQMLIVTCRLCLIYGSEDNDFNVLVMLAGLIWNLMSKKVIKIKHSLTTRMSWHGNVFFLFSFFLHYWLFMRGETTDNCWLHDDVIKWKHFPRYWPFVREIHRSRWISRTKASDAELWCLLWSASE